MVNSRKDEIARKEECGERKKKKLKRIAMEMMDFDNYLHEQNVKP